MKTEIRGGRKKRPLVIGSVRQGEKVTEQAVNYAREHDEHVIDWQSEGRTS